MDGKIDNGKIKFFLVDFFDENDVNLDRGEALAPNNKKDARDVVESTIQVKEYAFISRIIFI
jgi:hypothetical protein